jgi:DNA topoisomerase-1
MSIVEEDLSGIGLQHVDPSAPGYVRRRCGRGFAYLGPRGETVKSRAIRERLESLAAPPAWTDVWYCARRAGHIQAAGTDARGRRQYIYHPKWREWRDQQKFERMAEFGALLPKLRRKIRAALGGDDAYQVVCASVASLVDKAALRIGNDYYAEENGAYGASTLLKRHVRIHGSHVRLKFRAKGGKERDIELSEPTLAETLVKLRVLPGDRLFQVEEGGDLHRVTADDVNAWLREAAGADVTAKDFRTFRGSAEFVAFLARTELPDSERWKVRSINAAYAHAASVLGNTPAICKASYCAPRLADLWREARLAAVAERARAIGSRQPFIERLAIAAFQVAYGLAARQDPGGT